MTSICRDKKTGQMVEFIATHGDLFAQVKNSDGRVSYPQLTDLEFYEPGKGSTGVSPEAPVLKPVDPLIPEGGVLPMDTRLDMNKATAEMMTTVRGIGFATAKKIVELRSQMAGERFRTLDQLKAIPRVEWDEVLKDDKIYIG